MASDHVIILDDFNHTLLVMHAMFRMKKQILKYVKPFSCSYDWANGSLYCDSQKCVTRLQSGAGVCVVLTADTVATGEVNYKFDSANFCSSRRRSARANVAWQTALAWEEGKSTPTTDSSFRASHTMYACQGCCRQVSQLGLVWRIATLQIISQLAWCYV